MNEAETIRPGMTVDLSADKLVPFSEYSVNREFVEKAALLMNHSTKPFDINFGKKMRIVIDYDPQEPQVKFNFFTEALPMKSE